MSFRRITVTACLAGTVFALGGPTTGRAAEELSLEQIMADPDWIGNSPESAWWSDDGTTLYFEKKRDGSEVRDLYAVPAGGGEPRRVADRDLPSTSVAAGDWSGDHRRKVFVREGDVWWRDVSSGQTRQLTRTNERESDPQFLVGEHEVAFRRGGQEFARHLETGVERQLADLRLEKDPAEEAIERSYLEEQQERLFDVLRERRESERGVREREREEQRRDPSRPPLPFYLGESVTVLTRSLSPSGNWLLAVLGKKDAPEPKQDKMPRFVSATGYLEIDDVRPKVGAPKFESPKLVIFDLARHQRHDLDWESLPGLREDPLAQLRKAADAARKAREAERKRHAAEEAKAVEDDERSTERSLETDRASEEQATAARAQQDVEKEATTKLGRHAEARTSEPPAARPADSEEASKEKPAARPLDVGEIVWSEDGREVALQLYSRDNKDRWIARIDFAEPALAPLERIHDPAWINWSFRDIGWMPDGRTVWYLSEESGYSHLYLRPIAPPPAAATTRRKPVKPAPTSRQLTRGEFEVSDPVVGRDGRSFIVKANREHPGIHEIYRVDAATGDLSRLSRLGGENDAVVSPDESRLAILHSTATRRPELYVQDATPDAAARQLTDSVSAAYRAVDWTAPEFVAVPSTHQPKPIQSRLYSPPDWAAGPPRPAVLFVHGAGYTQEAHQGWSYYFRELMFHSLLARKGWVVLDMDYRASAGYGRDWRAAIYRGMGHPELEDLRDGVRWLAANRNVDPSRIGIYGGSYGGFLTLMALFTEPDLFQAGAALRPVTDWAHYNHEYTSNILNTPEVDPEAYARSSPIEFAAGLRKPLLIAHGMVDDNVVFQDTVRLTQRLIELEKTPWFETAIFPVEAHGFRAASSWLDEYTRILMLFERTIGRPRAADAP
jgi:dipeptidyl aminopeptidase/acylaminoacyl peptidase